MTFMRVTEGITEPHFTMDPLGTEAEMTPGPDDQNPYDDGEDFGGTAEPDLPPFLSDDAPLGGGAVVDDMDEAADERNERMGGLFAFDGISPAFDGQPIEQGEQYRW